MKTEHFPWSQLQDWIACNADLRFLFRYTDAPDAARRLLAKPQFELRQFYMNKHLQVAPGIPACDAKHNSFKRMPHPLWSNGNECHIHCGAMETNATSIVERTNRTHGPRLRVTAACVTPAHTSLKPLQNLCPSSLPAEKGRSQPVKLGGAVQLIFDGHVS